MLTGLLGSAAALGYPGADKIALDIGEAAEQSDQHSPGADAGVGPRFSRRTKLWLGVWICLTMANRSKVLRARRSCW